MGTTRRTLPCVLAPALGGRAPDADHIGGLKEQCSTWQ
jgi:hypothetical protein